MSAPAPGATTSGTLSERVLAAAHATGLDQVGICDATPFDDVRAVLEERREAGLHGGMQFTYRNPARSTDPSRALPGARSMVVAAMGHPHDRPADADVPSGRVARYATDDHYARLRASLQQVADLLVDEGHRAVVIADDNAMVDRAAAVRAGIGWYGKSSNVLLAGRGSWFLLGSVITDAPLDPNGEQVADGCGGCTRCIDGCPTAAIVAPGVVDARRCLAWHLQLTGDFPHEFRAALGDRIYGCDECQEVCPPNRRAAADESSTVADPSTPDNPAEPGDRVELLWMLRATDEELLARLGRWYVPRREPRYLRRNALVVFGNTATPADQSVAAVLGTYLDDPDDLLAAHAAWAALRLGRDELLEVGERSTRAAIVEERRRWPGASERREDVHR